MGNLVKQLQLDSKEVFDKEEHFGDVMSLDSFLNSCQGGAFIDYDGVVGEIIINGFVVCNDSASPSDFLKERTSLQELQEKVGEIKVVWYNR